MTKEQVLKEQFGYARFRVGQEALIDQILAGRDVLGIMPTGAGKSICFQVPALLLEGITLVISPLISLMKDQVQALAAGGVPAAFINSTLSPGQTHLAIQNARAGAYKLIYVAPERLEVPEFLDFAATAEIAMVTVDEAHCVSQWGQDFRPSYLKIGEFVGRLPRRPILSAFTATATDEVREDIIRMLGLDRPYVEATGFDRENLYFEVQKPRDKYRAVTDYLKANPGKSGIIYCATRKTVEQVCAGLEQDGYPATRYHAGLGEQERTANQDDFLYDRRPLMVATNAFGMGIDKSNVGFVIHYNMPKNLESYYQEAGRAGRDGTPADCILLYGGQDVVTNQFLIDRSNEQSELDPQVLEQVREKDRERLRQMTYYCHTTDCLRAYLLGYFGDRGPDQCGNCGSCRTQYQLVDIREDSQKILSCIARMGERYGLQLVVETLRGSRGQRLRDLGLDRLTTYGIMKQTPASRIREIMNYLVLHGYIVLSRGEYPVARLGPNHRELLYGTQPVWMKVTTLHPREEAKDKPGRRGKAAQSLGPMDQELLAKLKELRTRLAAQSRVPAYVIFSDATLVDLCRRKPRSEEELLEVSGVGAVKLQRYGRDFLEVVAGHSGPNTTGESSPEAPDAGESPASEGLGQSIAQLAQLVRESFSMEEEPAPVSALADRLTALLLQASSLKVTAVKLAKFYQEGGLLTLEESGGRQARVPTPQGEALGITSQYRSGPDGRRYRQNLYGPPAQHWLLDRLEELLAGLL